MLRLSVPPIDKFLDDFNEVIGGRNILAWGKYLANKSTTAFEVEHSGTLFKLYSLYSYLGYPYLPIMQGWRRKSNARRLIYVDAFCGNGLNVLKNKKNRTYVCGSSILALLASHRLGTRQNFNFDEMILIDLKKRNIKSLENRINDIVSTLGVSSAYSTNLNLNNSDNVHIVQGDIKKTNFVKSVADYLNNYWSRFPLIHIMFFIDPGTPASLTFATLKELLVFPGDLILLLHPGLFAEMYKKGRYRSSTLKSMLELSNQEIKDLETKTVKELQTLYVQKYCSLIGNIRIRNITTGSTVRNVIMTVDIQTKSGYYVLLYAVRTTGGGAHQIWQENVRKLADEIGKLSHLGGLPLEILLGKQDQITGFPRD